MYTEKEQNKIFVNNSWRELRRFEEFVTQHDDRKLSTMNVHTLIGVDILDEVNLFSLKIAGRILTNILQV